MPVINPYSGFFFRNSNNILHRILAPMIEIAVFFILSFALVIIDFVFHKSRQCNGPEFYR